MHMYAYCNVKHGKKTHGHECRKAIERVVESLSSKVTLGLTQDESVPHQQDCKDNKLRENAPSEGNQRADICELSGVGFNPVRGPGQ